MSVRVTLKDLAAQLALDKSSVSLALRDSPKISDATRARVREAARRMGYRPNLAARRLRTQRAQYVGLVFPASFHALTSLVVVRTIRFLAEHAAQRGLLFSILSCRDLAGAGGDASACPLLPHGVLLWGDTPAGTASELAAFGRPVLVLDPNHSSYRGYEGLTVRVANSAGAAALVGHLVERGVERLLFVRALPEHLGHEERWQGARDAWCRARSEATLTFRPAEQLADAELVSFSATRHGAIFCSNDFAAVQIWHRLVRLGVSVPDQVRLVGFDGTEGARMLGLTTALFDSARLAQVALAALCDLMEDRPAQTTPIAVEIQPGETT